MTKKTFIGFIDLIKYMDSQQELLNKHLQIIFDKDCQLFLNNNSIDQIMKLLQTEFNDKDDWLGWWIYEKEFGKRKDLDAKYKNGKEIKLNTADQLYDFLVRNSK